MNKLETLSCFSIDEVVAYKKKKECMHGAYGRKNEDGETKNQ